MIWPFRSQVAAPRMTPLITRRPTVQPAPGSKTAAPTRYPSSSLSAGVTSPSRAHAPQVAAQGLDVAGVVAQLCDIAGDYAESKRRGKETAADSWRGLFNMSLESRVPAQDRASVLAAMLVEGACKIDAERLAELVGPATGPGLVSAPGATISGLIRTIEGVPITMGAVAPGSGVGEVDIRHVLRLCAAAKGYTAALAARDDARAREWRAEWRGATTASGPRAEKAIAAAWALCPEAKGLSMEGAAQGPRAVEVSIRTLGWLALAASSVFKRRTIATRS